MKKEDNWGQELEKLRGIIQKTEMQKTQKWGGEVYTVNGGNVLSMAAFKNYVSLWFFNGVFLTDPYKVLDIASEGKAKALRHWRFTSVDEMEESKILEYIKEAIDNEKKGLKWKAEKSEPAEMPGLLADALQEDESLQKAFLGLTPFRQKEYVEHIISAKREKTKLDRLEKIKPMILQGLGLNDKYR